MQKCLFVCLLAACTGSLFAQSFENTINLSGTNFPREKIHVHFDKETYSPGETIWFKAYLFEENLPSERSTNFYAALYDEEGKLIAQRTSPVSLKSSDGHFVLPDSIPATQLIFRAYTSWMQDLDSTLIFSRVIRIINATNDEPGITPARGVNFHFFPEGGGILEGVVNTIAYKANYDNGLPFSVSAVLKKQETGEIVFPLNTVHDGMGKFDLQVMPNEKYYAEWFDENGQVHQTWLPEPGKTGLSLKCKVQKDDLYFNLINRTGSDSLHLLMYMYQKVFYKTDIKVDQNEAFTGVVPITGLPAGTVQITVFDVNWQPVAERVAFLNNKYNFPVTVIVKKTSFGKREQNLIDIVVSDSVPANMSLSITDTELNNEYSQHSIISTFLLSSELKGYVHNPAYYFGDNQGPEINDKIDLVMLTHGWRKYNWADLKMGKMPVMYNRIDVDYLVAYGKIGEEALRKMEKNEPVNLLLRTADSTNYFYSLIPNEAGYLKQSGLLFYDSASLYFTFNKSKLLNKQMSVSKSNFTIKQPDRIYSYKSLLTPGSPGAGVQQSGALFNYMMQLGKTGKFNNEKTLKTVVLKSGGRRNWQNDPLVKLDERYATGMFAGGALGYSVDVLHDEKAWAKLDIFNYIRSTVPGLTVGLFNLNTGRSLNYGGRSVFVYIDEHEMTSADLERLRTEEIAYIKFIPNYMGMGADPGGVSIRPVLSVYLKKGDDLIDRRPKETDLNVVKIAGYSPVKEFYAPDYSKSNTSAGADTRSTLLWMPYILTDKKNYRVPVTFYNNDFTGKFRLVLEGVNDNGKLVRIEKIIQ